MHIIGINIKAGDPKVIKNLGIGWYPFGNYDIPTKDNQYAWRDNKSYADCLYQTNERYPQISISCVVGENGSGKTTLIEIFYMILNNFSYCLLNSHDSYADTAYKVYAYGLEADLYYEVDGRLSYISIKANEEVANYYTYNAEQNVFEKSILPREQNEIDEFLTNFFYTIGMNYSLYSMQFEEDYDYNLQKEVSSEWLKFVFKNEDSMYYPLTIAPYRIAGQISVKTENRTVREQLTILFILQLSRCLSIANYRPIKIDYQINNDYEKKLGELTSLCIERHVANWETNEFISRFKEAWNSTLENLMGEKSLYEKNKELFLTYLAYNSFKLCLTYKSYGDLFKLPEMQKLFDMSDDATKFDYAKLGNYEEVVNKIKGGKDSITAFYHQFVQYLRRGSIHPEKGDIIIDELLAYLGSNITYNSIYESMPPAFYKSTLFLQKDKNNIAVPLDQLSSGEKQFLYSNSTILAHIFRIAYAIKDTRVIPYKNINIVIDEVELYSHPEFQRRYISDFVDLLNDLQIDKEIIHSINLIIATHSPFLLSDIPSESIVRMEGGKINKQHLESRTFCSNIYELLENSFFMKYPMGESARKLIESLLDAYNNNQDNSKILRIRERIEFYKYLESIVGDPYLRKTISIMLDSILENKKADIDKLKTHRERIEKELEKVNEQIDMMNYETN